MAARPSAQEADRSETRKDPIGVLVALEVPLLRLGVRAAVDAAGDCRVVGVISSEEEVVPAVARTRPDVVVLDTDYHRREPDLIAEITEAHPCSVLVLVNHSDEECVVRSMLSRTNAVKLTPEAYGRLNECCLLALRSSARGCAPKVGDPERLLAAIRTVAAGEVAAGPWLDALVLQSGSEPAYTETGRRRISARELDVITLVARGLENKEIARQLGIREQTVKNHLGRVMKKLGLRNRQELAVFAVKQHLVHMSWSP